MEATYRQEREWLNDRGPINGNGTAYYGEYGNHRGIGGFSGQLGQSQNPNQSHMGRNLSGWPLPSVPSDYQSPQANSNWSRDRPTWNNEMRRDVPYQAEPANTMNRSWSGNGGPSNGGPANASQWSNPNPKKQSMPLPPEDRGLPDHILKELSHLSAAKRKWFFHYVDMGFSNEKALARASEKRTGPAERYDKSVSTDRGRRRPELPVPGDRVRKRPNEENLSGGRAREEPKKQRAPDPSSRALGSKQNGFTMAVMAENYPDCVLTNKQLHEIEDGLVEEMKKGWKSSINFGGIQFLSGLIQIVCMDKNSRQWLEHAINKLPVLPEIKLICCPEDEIPATKGITVYVPRSAEEPDTVTFELLKDQNTDLLSKTWEVGRISKTKEGKLVAISIGSKSYKLLQKNGFCLSYRFNQLTCREMRGKEALKAVRVNQPEETKPNSEAEAAECIADSAEIDLTEEDGEEFISQLDLTVVDEVKGDDDDDENENEISEVQDDVEEVAEDQHDDLEIIEGKKGVDDDVQVIEMERDEEENNDDTADGECEVVESSGEEHQEQENSGNAEVVEDEACSSEATLTEG
ncbi:uncharacterized protein LOC113564233 [Drosophila erecta]|uniref:DUF4780 domain-containing protein n=1 Tax=Drosophila erecta TaxID=7220 RepID=B3NAN3_DROER|nr:uncharacterized protein LOC6541923 [Drosophila erecta]XP_026835622.1 uncharacterized protein LOC113564233 [Drosophila erecta]EDV57556.1 uncharacterized protein Dere_GG24472 [Drosophila erecta]